MQSTALILFAVLLSGCARNQFKSTFSPIPVRPEIESRYSPEHHTFVEYSQDSMKSADYWMSKDYAVVGVSRFTTYKDVSSGHAVAVAKTIGADRVVIAIENQSTEHGVAPVTIVNPSPTYTTTFNAQAYTGAAMTPTTVYGTAVTRGPPQSETFFMPYSRTRRDVVGVFLRHYTPLPPPTVSQTTQQNTNISTIGLLMDIIREEQQRATP